MLVLSIGRITKITNQLLEPEVSIYNACLFVYSQTKHVCFISETLALGLVSFLVFSLQNRKAG